MRVRSPGGHLEGTCLCEAGFCGHVCDRMKVACVGWGGGGGREKRVFAPLGFCVQRGVYLRCVCEHAASTPTPPSPACPREEGDLIWPLGALGVSGFLSSPISPAHPPPPPPGRAPSSLCTGSRLALGFVCCPISLRSESPAPEPKQGPGEMAVGSAAEGTQENLPQPHVSAR